MYGSIDVFDLVSAAVRYQCMGSWFAMVGNTGYTFAAIADTVENDKREKFKCMVRKLTSLFRTPGFNFEFECILLNYNIEFSVKISLH